MGICGPPSVESTFPGPGFPFDGLSAGFIGRDISDTCNDCPQNHCRKSAALNKASVGVISIHATAHKRENHGADLREIHFVRIMAEFAALFQAAGLKYPYYFNCRDTNQVADLRPMLAQGPADGEVRSRDPDPISDALSGAGASASHARLVSEPSRLSSVSATCLDWVDAGNVAKVVLMAGNEARNAPQATAVSTGFPFTIVLLVMTFSLNIGLRKEHKESKM